MILAEISISDLSYCNFDKVTLKSAKNWNPDFIKKNRYSIELFLWIGNNNNY